MYNRGFHLNVRVLVAILLLAVLAGVGVYFAHQYQMKQHALFYLEQARLEKKQLEQTDEPEEKLRQFHKVETGYQKYLNLVPDDVQVMSEEALLLYEVGNFLREKKYVHDARKLYGQSIGILEKALRFVPQDKTLRRQAVDLLFSLQQYRDVISHLRYLGEVPKDRDALQKWFDRYELWETIQRSTGQSAASDLSYFSEYGKESIQTEKLLQAIGDENLWMVLEDPDLLYVWGECQLHLDQARYAIKPLEKGISLAPHKLKFYPALARALREMDRPTDAEYWMTEVVDANPDDPEAYSLRAGFRLARVGKVDEDSEAIEMALSAQEDAMTMVTKAIQHLVEKTYRDRSLQAKTKSLQEAFDRLTVLRKQSIGEIRPAYRDQLIKTARLAIESAESIPDSDEEIDLIRQGLFLTGDAAVRRFRREGTVASKSLDEVSEDDSKKRMKEIAFEKTPTWEEAKRWGLFQVELFPENERCYMMLAYLEQLIGNPQEAYQWLRRGKEKTKGSILILWQLAGREIEKGEIEKAQALIAQLRKEGASEILLAHLLAQIDFANQKWNEAAEAFEKVRLQLSLFPQEVRKIDWLLAECYGKLGRRDDQRDAYMRAIASDRTWLPALYGLARSRANSGEIDEALKDYRLVLRYPKVPLRAHLEYAHLLLRANRMKPSGEQNWDEVEKAIEKVEKLLPDSIGIFQLRVQLMAAKGKVDEALGYLDHSRKQIELVKQETLKQRDQLMAEARDLSGEAKEAKLAEAKKLLLKARREETTRQMIWQLLVQIGSQHSNRELADRILSLASSELGDTPQIRLLRATEAVRQDPKKASEEIRQLAEKTDSFTSKQQMALFSGLASLASKVKDGALANDLCLRAEKLSPNDLGLLKTRFRIAMRGQDIPAMEAALKRVKEIEGKEDEFAFFGDSVVLMLRSEKEKSPQLLEEARLAVNQALLLRPKWPAAKLMLAQILAKQNQEDAAVEMFIESVEGGMRDPEVVQQVSHFLMKQGRFREADNLFKQLGSTRESLKGVERELRSVKTRLGEYGEAIDFARKVAQDSNQYGDWIWLGQLSMIHAKQERSESHAKKAEASEKEAENAFRKAIALDSKLPGAWVSLIQLAGQKKNQAMTQSVMEEARKAISPEQVGMAMAQAYEILQQTDLAAAEYEKAIAQNPKDAALAQLVAQFYLRNKQPGKAEKQLMQIIEGEVEAKDTQRRWAKRAMAALLFDRGDPQNQQKMIRLLDENLAVDPSSFKDLYTKALLLLADVTGEQHRKGAAILEQIVQDEGASYPEAVFTLASYYLEKEQWSKYKDRMRELLEEHKDQARYVGSFVEALSQKKEFPEAEKWIAQLHRIAPDSDETVQVQAKLFFAKKEYDSVVRTLDNWSDQTAGNPKERKRRKLVVAKFLAAFATELAKLDKDAMADFYQKQAETRFGQAVSGQKDAPLKLAIFLANMGKVDQAVEHFINNWEGHDPRQVAAVSFKLVNARGVTASDQQKITRVLKKALAVHPDASILQITYGVAADLQGNTEEAEAVYRKTLAAFPENPTAMNNLAVHLALRQVKLNEATRLLDRAIELAGPQADLLDSRALLSLVQGKNQAALADLQRAIHKKPNEAVYYFHLARVLYQDGKTKLALEALKKAEKRGLYEELLTPVERRVLRKMKVTL